MTTLQWLLRVFMFICRLQRDEYIQPPSQRQLLMCDSNQVTISHSHTCHRIFSVSVAGKKSQGPSNSLAVLSICPPSDAYFIETTKPLSRRPESLSFQISLESRPSGSCQDVNTSARNPLSMFWQFTATLSSTSSWVMRLDIHWQVSIEIIMLRDCNLQCEIYVLAAICSGN